MKSSERALACAETVVRKRSTKGSEREGKDSSERAVKGSERALACAETVVRERSTKGSERAVKDSSEKGSERQ